MARVPSDDGLWLARRRHSRVLHHKAGVIELYHGRETNDVHTIATAFVGPQVGTARSVAAHFSSGGTTSVFLASSVNESRFFIYPSETTRL